MRCALGLDYGTNSVRALIVDVDTGETIGSAVAEYASGERGILLDPRDPHLARQNPNDWFEGFFEAVTAALGSLDPSSVAGLGVDTTGSTPLPIDARGRPLALEMSDRLDAQAWLWKDHTAIAEAEEITARGSGTPHLANIGGKYSSEWFWAKLLRCIRHAPDVVERSASWVEMCDLIPAWLTGIDDVTKIPRSACAAGHKALWHSKWGGLPPADFLAGISPELAAYRSKLYDRVVAIDHQAGTLEPSIAARAGLAPTTVVAAGAFDAHLGAVGAGIRPGMLVKIMGTSTCDIMVAPDDGTIPDIPGLCGVAENTVIPGMLGLEAGQSAVGDLFAWGASLSGDDHDRLQNEATRLRPGESGLLALDWNNGNRTILVDQALTGLLVGQTLHTSVAEIYRSLIEATAFGARRIIERIEEYGVPVREVVCCGGIAVRSPLTMQIYADVTGRPIRLSRSEQTCALGAAIAGAVAAGLHPSVADAQAAMTGFNDAVFTPGPGAVAVYNRLYSLYLELHDAFGTPGSRDLSGVMKALLAIRKEVVA